MKTHTFARKPLALVLALLLVVNTFGGFTATAFADDASSPAYEVTWEKVDSNVTNPVSSGKEILTSATETVALQYKDSDTVRVSIVLPGASTLEMMNYETQGIGSNTKAVNYRDALKKQQAALAETISAKALGGEALDVVWNLTLAANIISANVKYGQIKAIQAVDGVKDVVIETVYEPDVASVEADDPNMSVASGMTGGTYAWAAGFTGAGSKVAIIDTGLDTDHQSFDAGAFEYAIAQVEEEKGASIDLLTAEDVAAVFDQLNIGFLSAYGLTADHLYNSSKVPFAFNYVDISLDVTHDNDKQGEHGSHVAGIAAANRYIPDGEGYTEALTSVFTQGEAPDAQIVVMKVFGQGGGAYDSDYFSAIEDAIILGCDSVNLSLGSSSVGMAANSTYADLLDSLSGCGTAVVCSGGNASNWAQYTSLGYLYPDSGTYNRAVSPGSYANMLSVASVDNDGFTGNYLLSGDSIIFYSETNDYSNKPLASIPGEYDYVYIDSVGYEEDFAAVDVEGKIAICNRGDLSFYVKANNAAAAGAVASIIANNQDGTINMNLTGYEYSNPSVAITLADGLLLKANATSMETITVEGEAIDVYYGTLTVGGNTDIAVINYENDSRTMSSFSSWGVPGDLRLKPEITAPGGDIYSVNGAVAGGTAYENMSGTSMAAPQITGLIATFAQYIRENGLVEKTGLTTRQLAYSLLMSTATPLIEEDSGYYYSVMSQGAGLVDLESAINAKSYILMDESATVSAVDGKVKAELGEEDDSFSIEFSVNNFSDEDLRVNLRSEFFTQDLFMYYAYDMYGSMDGSVTSVYRDTWTTPIDSYVEWTVDGNTAFPEFSSFTDVNNDGALTLADATDLLKYVTGEISEEETSNWNFDMADQDENGVIDSFDAYLLLALFDFTEIIVPANSSVNVKADVTIDMSYFADYDGNYIEGYIFVTEADSEDGAIGVEHSIPVFGFYGDWTEASMFDIGSFIDYYYGLEDRAPYMMVADSSATSSQYFGVKYAGFNKTYAVGGNPIMDSYDEDENIIYQPERNAISAETELATIRYSQVRNGAATRFSVTDQDGNVYYELFDQETYGAFYHVNDAVWKNTSTSFNPKYKVTNVPEGSVLTYDVAIAPEYYVDEDGNVDWDALGDGAHFSIDLTVDNTAPEVLDISVDTGILTGDISGDHLVLQARDNQYIAGAFLYDEDGLLLDYTMADTEADANEVYKSIFAVDLDERDEEGNMVYAHLRLNIYDYAMNVSTYKINLNAAEEFSSQIELSLSDDEISLLGNGGQSYQLSYTMTPWGIEQVEGLEFSWTSTDESIAVVNDSGIVTAVATDNGSCEIIASVTYNGVTVSDSCTVTVFFLEKVLDCVVWDENGEVWLSTFNTRTLPEYVKKTDAPLDARLGSIAVDDAVYAVTLDDYSSLYIIDENNELSLIGESDIWYADIAPAYGISYLTDTGTLMGAYGPYVVLISEETGNYYGAFDATDDVYGEYIIGLSYAYTIPYSDYETYVDSYFALTTSGELYLLYFAYIPMYDGFYSLGSEYLGNLEYDTDSNVYNSLYFDGADLYWSRFLNAESRTDIVMVQGIVDDEGYVYYVDSDMVYNMGSFEADVWPVGGLYEDPYAESGLKLNSAFAPTFALGAQSVAEVAYISNSLTKSAGSLNAINGSVSVSHPEAIVSESDRWAVSYEGEITADADIHNALVVVEYDPATVAVELAPSAGEFTSYFDNGEGKIAFGFISREALEADSLIAALSAGLINGAETGTVKVSVTEKNFAADVEVIKLGYQPDVTRIYGSTRYNTAFLLADELKATLGVDTFDSVIIASGEGFADALSGSYLSSAKNAPILYVNASTISKVADYVADNLRAGGTVYILGGEASVPAEMEAALAEIDGSVERLAGKDRYATNLAIIEAAGLDDASEVIVATGKNFADAISASSAGLPILLVGDNLSAEQEAFLAGLTDVSFTIVGGTASVSADIESALAACGSVTRLAGSNRYETSKLIAEKFFAEAETVILAYGENYPDGMAVGVLGAALKAPVVLASSSKTAPAKAFVESLDLSAAYVIGGSGLISDSAVVKILGLSSADLIQVVTK